MAQLIGSPKAQFFDTTTQEFLVGGLLYSYEAGTNIPVPTYPTMADALAGTNPNTNPIVLDARGEANVVVSGATKLVLFDSNNNQIWSVDNIDSISGDIIDSNNNILLSFTQTANAINHFNIHNAIAGSGPIIESVGDDTNIDFNLNTKGTGKLKITGDTNINGNVAVTGNTTLTGNATITGTLSVAGTNITPLPLGVVYAYVGSTVPTTYLECDGSAISRTDYAALFAIIGTSFGTGDGSTTFNLPNMQRRVIVGRGGSGTATLANTIAATGGEEAHALTSAENGPHTHSLTTSNSGGFIVASSAGLTAANIGSGAANWGIQTVPINTGSTGSGTAHNNIQPSIVMMYIIKASY